MAYPIDVEAELKGRRGNCKHDLCSITVYISIAYPTVRGKDMKLGLQLLNTKIYSPPLNS